jgi:hypothetical protein
MKVYGNLAKKDKTNKETLEKTKKIHKRKYYTKNI